MAVDALSVGSEVTATVVALGHGGEGVARSGGLVLFVPGALPGDTVVARVVERRPSYVRAELAGVLEPSPDRQLAPCPVVHACGGCPLQTLAPAAQRREKRRRLVGLLGHVGRLKEPPVAEVRSAGPDYGYRAKASLVAGADENGGLRLGFYGAHSHRLVAAASCLVADDAVRRAAAAAEAALAELLLPPYDEASDRGFVRHVVIRHAQGTGQLMVLVVTRTAHWPGFERLPEAMRRRLGSALTCLAHSVHSRPGNRVLGGAPAVLAGEDAIWEETLGLRLRISPASFYQVNPPVAAAMYAHVLEALRPAPGDVVLDAHAGVGAIALLAARQGAHAVGFETEPQAVADAVASAAAAGLADRAQFVRGQAERLYPVRYARRAPDAVVLDPPRAGCHPDLVAALRRMPPRRLVYVSCDGATLARDLRRLVADGRFALERVTPFDLFPHTAHLEAVAVLRRGLAAERTAHHG